MPWCYMRSTLNIGFYIVGIGCSEQTDYTCPILQCFTCDDEQAGNTKNLTLHLQELILTTEQRCRKLQMMHNVVSREAMLAECKQMRTDSFKRSKSVLSSIHPWSPCHLLRHPVPLALGFQ